MKHDLFPVRRVLSASISLIVLVSLVGTLLADDAPSSAARLAALQADVADAKHTFEEAWKKQPDPDVEDPEVEKLYQVFQLKQKLAFAEAVMIAQADPKSPTGFAALEWLLLTPQAYNTPPFKPALALLIEHHAANPQIGKGLAIVGYYPPHEEDAGYDGVATLFRAALEKNPDRAARGHAALALAWVARRDYVNADYLGADNAEELRAAAEKQFETVIRDFGDCENLRTLGARQASKTLAGEAERELFELRNLRVGKPAPDIEAADLAGTKFKLSDYQGQVRLLVFWASWCGPCMGSVPHERELVARFQGRPFVLVGVNGDDTTEAAQAAVAKHSIPWRSFWNGEKGASGPIADAWNVRGWPTVYVIDHLGIIRYKQLHGEKLDEPLDQLVAEAEKARAAQN